MSTEWNFRLLYKVELGRVYRSPGIVMIVKCGKLQGSEQVVVRVETIEYRNVVGMMETFRLRACGRFWDGNIIIGLGEVVSL